jgi:hypothetical protein
MLTFAKAAGVANAGIGKRSVGHGTADAVSDRR